MYHQPVLLNESIEGLNIDPDGIYVDATYGGGGHSQSILQQLNHGKLIAFDQDIEAESNVVNDDRLSFIRHNFRYMKNFLKYTGFIPVDGILADLGVSSHHLNAPERGFSFRFDAPLDMRMNQNTKLTAQYVINHYQAGQLDYILKNYGEIRRTRSVVNAILEKRSENKISSVNELVNALEPFIPKKTRNKFLAQVFQALRIEVNQEIRNLKSFLKQSLELLRPGGRIAVISYHSIEDRVVKNFFKTGNFEGKLEKDFYGNTRSPFNLVNRKIITPGEEEIKRNNRARSAKLRIAEKEKDNDR
jgi:16S rRNA (cytosine1402-N4)-methyltransferase